jgi:hypothetical protein
MASRLTNTEVYDLAVNTTVDAGIATTTFGVCIMLGAVILRGVAYGVGAAWSHRTGGKAT